MRKKIFSFAITLLFSIAIIYASMPDYHIVNSISFDSDCGRETTLKVIVYKYHDLDSLVNKIRLEHNRINITPNELTIRLYHSRHDIKKGKEPFKIIILILKDK